MIHDMSEIAMGNLDSRAQNLQLRIGVGMIAAALAVAVISLGFGVPSGYRVLLGLPLFFGTYGVYAGLTRTCGFTALRGMRMTESGPVPVADKTALAAHRHQGFQVICGSAIISVAATLLLLIAH